jgi:hypothetical protein
MTLTVEDNASTPGSFKVRALIEEIILELGVDIVQRFPTVLSCQLRIM